ncbi:TPM domain-containing protein [Altericroceibacterium endophyticum]|nr:TPM domain-containing protein [Altericroceibacterium endophyticum]
MVTLTEQDHAIVREAVAQAELKSSGEIVTIITDQSDTYGDIALAWAAAVSLTLLTILSFEHAFLLDWYAGLHDAWNAAWLPADLFAMAAGVGIFSFLIVWLAQLWLPLRFAMVPGRVKDARVQDRAIDLFRVGAENLTSGRTGILIYLSMREHRAEILADEAIAAKVPPETWGDAMGAMLGHMKEGRIADGLAAAVSEVGDVLAEHLPRADDDENELPDRLIHL